VLSGVFVNLRYSARSFTRRPGPTLALLFTVALGIASNISVRGFVRGLTTPSFPLGSLDGLVSIFRQDAHREGGPLTRQEYLYVTGRRDVFQWFGAARVSPGAVTVADQTAFVPIAAVMPNLAGLFGLSLDKGVVISHRMWQGELGSASARGEEIQINGITARIGGIAPDWLDGIYRDRPVDVWMPWREEASQRPEDDTRNLWVLARLDRDVSAIQAQAALRPGGHGGELRVVPYTGMTPEAAAGLSRVRILLEFAAGAVFFIACVNVCLLLLVRSFTKFHETALRVSLGASRRQLARQMLSDSVVISVAGGATGMLLALWTSYIVPALLYERDAERLVFASNLFGIAETSFVLVGIMILSGLLPVLVIPHENPMSVLQRHSARASPAIRRLQFGLVAAQMASCCLLVVSAAFLLQGLRAALVTSAGPQLGHTVLASVQGDPRVAIEYFRRAEQAAKSVPGVSGIEWASNLPGSQPVRQSFRIVPAQSPLREVTLDTDWITDSSVKLFKLPPKAGHMFGVAEEACRAAIVNAEAAQKLFGGYTAGETLRAAENSPPIEIIGVVATRESKPGTVNKRPTLYYDYTGRQETPPRRIPDVQFRTAVVSQPAWAELETDVVSAGYFDAVGIKLIRGQGFNSSARPAECRTGIVNQEAADLYFGGKADGAAVIDEQGRRTDIIGVVHSELLGTFQRHVEPTLYLPMSQNVLPRMSMMIRVRGVSGLLLGRLQRALEVVPGRGPSAVLVRTLETYLNQTSLAPLHIAAVLLGLSATMGLLLSVFGLFGALSDVARQRRRELAVRIALGAQRWRVVGHVLSEGIRLAGAGTVAGMLASLALSRWMIGITRGSGSPTLWVWLAAPIALAGVVTLASVLPARRALMVNPIEIMGEDG
jgi:ABC-type lipoprotein release transport system permease subunit